MKLQDPLGRPIRAALFLGFGLVVGIWLFTAFYFTRRIADVENQATAINARYGRAQEVISTVRAQMLLGSVYMRDALLDGDPVASADYRRRLDEADRAVELAMHQYVPVLDSPAERDQVARLQEEIDEFHRTLQQTLATDTSRGLAEARELLRTHVMPRREAVIGLSEQAQTLNRNAFIQQQSAIAAVYSRTQRRIWESLGVALATSLGIALLAAWYAGRLEDRIRRQREKDVQTTHDLQLLSAKLLTAQEEERRSLARELHDEVGQALTAIKVEIAVAQRTRDLPPDAIAALDDARSIADVVLHTVRDLSHLLHPSLLDDLGLAAATQWYLKGFGKRHDLRTDLQQDGMDARLAAGTESAVYRIIQEALTNVAKHARATGCRVYLQHLPNTLLVTIEDDGVGFELNARRPFDGARGLGLVNIRERVAQLGGTVRLETTPGKGTRITVEVPAVPRAAGSGVLSSETTRTDLAVLSHEGPQ